MQEILKKQTRKEGGEDKVETEIRKAFRYKGSERGIKIVATIV